MEEVHRAGSDQVDSPPPDNSIHATADPLEHLVSRGDEEGAGIVVLLAVCWRDTIEDRAGTIASAEPWIEPIPESEHREDEPGMLRRLPQFSAQTADVNLKRRGVREPVATPHLGEQFAVAPCDARL